MNYQEYWEYPDLIQGKMYEIVKLEFMNLQDEILSFYDRFEVLEGDLDKQELQRLKLNIAKFETSGYSDSYNLRLQMMDLKRRKRVKRDEAFIFLLFGAFVGSYFRMMNESVKLYSLVAKEKFLQFGAKEEVNKEWVNNLCRQPLATGISPKQGIEIEAQFRANQVAKAIRASKTLQLDGACAVDIELKKAQSAMLKKREPVNDVANRVVNSALGSNGAKYYGKFDEVMTAIIGYSIIAAAQATNAKEYRFKAMVDKRTTPICQYLNEKVFKVEKMLLGVNVPPISVDMRTGLRIIHPCRSWVTLIRK